MKKTEQQIFEVSSTNKRFIKSSFTIWKFYITRFLTARKLTYGFANDALKILAHLCINCTSAIYGLDSKIFIFSFFF